MKVYSLGTLEKEEDRRCSSYFVSQTGIKILLEVLGFYEEGFRLLIIMEKKNVLEKPQLLENVVIFLGH